MNNSWFSDKRACVHVIYMTHQKSTTMFSTCCQGITFIIQSTYVYIASRHYLVEHIITYRIQSKISQPANSKTTAQVKIDFLSRYRSVDLGFVLPSQWCRSYQRETYYNNNKHTSKTAAERGAIREHR